MKHFIESMGEKFTTTSKQVVSKTKKMNDAMKIAHEIERLQTQADELLLVLGKRYYTDSKTSPNELYEELIHEIESQFHEIETLHEQLSFLKGKKICPRCHSHVTRTAVYCEQCGLNIVSYMKEKFG